MKRLWIICFVSLYSCRWNPPAIDKQLLARVANERLTIEEVRQQMPRGFSQKDSVAFVHHYVQQWIATRLLAQQGEEELPEAIKEDIEKQLQRLRYQYYAQAYVQYYLSQSLDTLFPEEAYQKAYELHKKQLLATQPWVRYRYVLVRRLTDLRLFQKLLNQENPLWETIRIEAKRRAVRYDLQGQWKPQDSLIALGKLFHTALHNYQPRSQPYVLWVTYQKRNYLLLFQYIERIEVGEPMPLVLVRPQLKQYLIAKREKQILKSLIQRLVKQKQEKDAQFYSAVQLFP